MKKPLLLLAVVSGEKRTLFDRAGIPRNQWHNYKVENYLASKVRRGEMSLSEAQAEIQHWETVQTPGEGSEERHERTLRAWSEA